MSFDSSNNDSAQFVQSSDSWLWISDQDMNLTYLSPNIEALTGKPREEFLGKSRYQHMAEPEDSDLVRQHLEDVKACLPFKCFVYRARRSDGSLRWIESSGTPIFDDDGQFLGYRGIARYRTDEVRRLARLEQANRDRKISQTVFGHVERLAKIGAWKLDLETGQLEFSDETFRIYELPRCESVPREVGLAPYRGETRQRIKLAMRRTIETGEPFDETLSFVTAKGNFRWVRALGELEKIGDKPTNLFGTCQDVTEERNRQLEMRRLAETDHLTGVANRSAFQAVAREALEGAVGLGSFGALCLVDLDRFKQINDHYGHAAGDAVLMETTHWLNAIGCQQHTSVVARLGGDEFAVIMTGFTAPDVLDQAVRDSFRDLDRKMTFRDQVLEYGASVGYVVFPEQGCDLDELMVNADLALYDAKSRERRTISKYRPKLGQAFTRRMGLVGEFRRAMRNGEIEPYFQPVIDISTEQVTGFEALARWNHPERGVLAAGTFSDVFENPEIVSELGDIMLSAVVSTMQEWKQAGLSFGRVGFNITDVNLLEPGFALNLSAQLGKAGLLPSQIVLEITENTIFNSVEQTVETLNALQDMGVVISLDDFGTGHSSLTHLQDIPFSILKIDKAFIRGITTSKVSRGIVESLVSLGDLLGYSTVAEGVETQADLDCLREIRCQRAQGYFYARPMPATDVPVFLSERERRQNGDGTRKAAAVG